MHLIYIRSCTSPVSIVRPGLGYHGFPEIDTNPGLPLCLLCSIRAAFRLLLQSVGAEVGGAT